LIITFGVLPPVLADVDPRDQAPAAMTPDDVGDVSRAVSEAMSDLRVGVWQPTSIAQGDRTIEVAVVELQAREAVADSALQARHHRVASTENRKDLAASG
jgi:hypothetical protein